MEKLPPYFLVEKFKPEHIFKVFHKCSTKTSQASTPTTTFHPPASPCSFGWGSVVRRSQSGHWPRGLWCVITVWPLAVPPQSHSPHHSVCVSAPPVPTTSTHTHLVSHTDTVLNVPVVGFQVVRITEACWERDTEPDFPVDLCQQGFLPVTEVLEYHGLFER